MVSAIILAAGSSSRMGGENKLLLPFRSSTVIEETVCQVLGAGIDDVVVVTGFQQEQVSALLAGLRVTVVFNENYRTGMTSSIKAGIGAARGSAFMICLGDLPTIQSHEYRLLAERANELEGRVDTFIVLPRFQQRKANPVIFSDSFRTQILAHESPEGCKDIVAANRNHIHWVDMHFDHVLRDIDSKSDYENLINDLENH